MRADAARALAEAVQANCHIADARHAADLTLCTYLLQMREFFRWERGHPFGAELARAEVGSWIAEREALWDRVQADAWLPLPLPGGAPADPFDAAAVNARLEGSGLLYGAGLVGRGRPVFFLAELHGRALRDGIEVRIGGRELARGLLAPPAALADGLAEPQIVLRRESLARWGWERFEAFALRRRDDSAFAAAVRHYGLDGDFDGALARFVDNQAEAALLHEIGEWRIGRRLGPAWGEMLLALPNRRGELYARALRDQIADLTTTLPTLLDRGAEASIHVWFAGYDGVREQLYPGLVDAYRAWRGGDRGAALRRACAAGRAHFEPLARRLLAYHAAGGPDAAAQVEAALTAAATVCRG
jgi:hypothetical protein